MEQGITTQIAGVKDKHRAKRVNPVAGNCNVAHIVRFATLPPPYLKARRCASTTQPPSTSEPCVPSIPLLTMFLKRKQTGINIFEFVQTLATVGLMIKSNISLIQARVRKGQY